jgi:hypothetical protein
VAYIIPDAVRKKLVNMLGPVGAERLLEEVMPRLRLDRLQHPNDCYRFGGLVCERGGMFAVLGKSIQTQAILNGADRP